MTGRLQCSLDRSANDLIDIGEKDDGTYLAEKETLMQHNSLVLGRSTLFLKSKDNCFEAR